MNKVLYITQGLNRASGASKSGSDVLRAISLYHEVEVVTNRNLTSPFKVESYKAKVSFKYVKRFLTKKISLRNLYYYAMNCISSKKYYCKKDIDLVLVNSFCSKIFNSVDFSESNAKKVCVVRGSISSFKSDSSAQVLKEALSYLSQFDGYIFVSSNTQKEWMLEPELTGKSAYYIPNCCNESEVDNLLKQNRESIKQSLITLKKIDLKNKFIISCIGSVQKRKGQDLLVSAALELLKSKQTDLLVILVGGSVNGFEQHLKDLIDESGFADNFIFTGYIKESLSYLYISDLMVLPSRGEAMPRSVLESMALSVPVITSNLDGMPELIVNGETGILLDELDVPSIKKALDFMINNESVRNEFSVSSHKKYWSDFSHELQINRYKSLLEKLL
ncbi:glycosyltransferase family 4 protein [uncultured Psychrosphaera sp.]|jgi:glycosyltransferase involved in cell wall biosynthesis|uniref:glycosyltransferase family 4 protein n=1 Tax=uncultured Psychrosphaera sp. TaxID=1403522 RepID=UPI002604BF2B|nr:glycosyltransferase family 4 protein [uncultured Psychrosphaera sp.]